MVHNLAIILVCVLTYLLLRSLLGRMVRQLSARKDIGSARVAFISRTINMALFFTMVSVALLGVGFEYGQVSLFVSSVFAVIGIALFAQWSILSNLTGSLIIFFAFPYRVGHRVKVVDKDDDICGVIQSIEPFHVLIRRDNGDVITYPNSLILQKAVIRLAADKCPPPATAAAPAAAPAASAESPSPTQAPKPG